MQYYYSLDGQDKKGPVDESQLISLGVKADSLVWSENMNDWTPAAQVDALSYLFRDDKTVMQNIPKISEVPKIPVNQQPPMPQTHYEERKKNHSVLWIVLGAVGALLLVAVIGLFMDSGGSSNSNEAHMNSNPGKVKNEVAKSYEKYSSYSDAVASNIEGFNESQITEGGLTASQAFLMYMYDIIYGNPGGFVSTLKFEDKISPQMQQQFIESIILVQHVYREAVAQGATFRFQITNEIDNGDGSFSIYSKFYINGVLQPSDDNKPEIMFLGPDGYWYDYITYEDAIGAIQDAQEMRQQMY